jgi:hypothetical protein
LPCAWYRFKIEQRYGTEGPWELVDHGESSDTFWLEDDTGRVLVDPQGAEIHTRNTDSWNGPRLPFARVDPWEESSVYDHGRRMRRYRCTEERLIPGGALYVIGMLKNLDHHANQPTVEEEARALVIDWKQDQEFLLEQFDLNQDGNIDMQEWRLARQQARREVARKRRAQQLNFAEGIDVVIRPDDWRHPFIISSHPQDQLTGRYRRDAILYSIAFLFTGSVLVWLANRVLGGAGL